MEEALNNKNNKSRELNFDLLKVVATVFMVLCHIVLRLASHRENYESELGYIFADYIFGSYLAVAHAFMFAMGVGIILSNNQDPKYLIKRGIFFLILSYVLNFLRYGIYALALALIEGDFWDEVLYAFTCHDIFDFVGLALIVTGILKLVKLKSIHILIIGIVLSIIGTLVAFNINGNWITNYFLGFFVVTTEDESTFVFYNWYIFIGVGLVFGELLKNTRDKDKFYLRLLISSSVVVIAYIILTSIFGLCFLSKNGWYYACSVLEDIGYLSIDFVLLSLFHFITRKKDNTKTYWYTRIGKNVTIIYIIHWCIIGFVDSIFGYLLEIIFPYWILYIMGVVILIASVLLSFLFEKYRNKKNIQFKYL